MSTWHYAYFFPMARCELRPAAALSLFEDHGLEASDTIAPHVMLDDGHSDPSGKPVRLSEPFATSIRLRLGLGEQFQACWNNKDLFFYCDFAHLGRDPHVNIAWSRRLFDSCDEIAQHRYKEMLLDLAKAMGAAYVIIVAEPWDYFEEYFRTVEDHKVLECRLESGEYFEIIEVWIDNALVSDVPEGVDAPVLEARGDFSRHEASCTKLRWQYKSE